MNINEIIRSVTVFKPDDTLIEVRSFSGKQLSGYFRDKANMIEWVKKYPNNTFYFVMNEIKDECYNREQCEKLIPVKGATTDKDIKRNLWLLIDADPERSTGISATDEEKERAKETIGKVHNWLRDLGFAYPVVADSGNGYHLLYNVFIDTLPQCTEIIKQFLQVLDMYFSDDRVKIDTSVFNPSRITKLYGTVATKGANTAERPHRLSRILRVPEEIKPTSIELVKKVADMLPKPEKKTYSNYQNNDKFDLESFISKHGIRLTKTARFSAGTKYVLEECLFDPSHKEPDAAILHRDDGIICYKCFHDSCQGKSWRDVRLMFEPDAYDNKYEDRISQETRSLKPLPDVEPTAEIEVPSDKFLRLQDIQVLDRSKIITVASGFAEMDKKIIGFNKGEFSIWSGGNGSGKSTLLSQIALESVNKGFNVAMFSGELTSNRIKNWLHLQAAGRQFTKLASNGVAFYVPTDTGTLIDEWTADKLWVYNNNYGFDAMLVLADFERHIERNKSDVIIIDNLMSLDFAKIQGDKYDKQSQLVLTLSALAKKYNVHIHFVCHPRKPNGFLRKSDISGTADLTNAADNVFMVHRVNNDFKNLAGQFFDKAKAAEYHQFSNVIEIMKNRDLGVEDVLIGLYFENESKRMLSEKYENKVFGWQSKKSINEIDELENGLPV